MITLLIFAFNQAHSQATKKEAESKKYIFGLKTGANFSWYKPDSRDLLDGGLKPGFSYGIMGDYNFAPNYSVST